MKTLMDEDDPTIPLRMIGTQKRILDLINGKRKPTTKDDFEYMREIREAKAKGQMIDLDFD